jgi:hypothetical protein
MEHLCFVSYSGDPGLFLVQKTSCPKIWKLCKFFLHNYNVQWHMIYFFIIGTYFGLRYQLQAIVTSTTVCYEYAC